MARPKSKILDSAERKAADTQKKIDIKAAKEAVKLATVTFRTAAKTLNVAEKALAKLQK